MTMMMHRNADEVWITNEQGETIAIFPIINEGSKSGDNALARTRLWLNAQGKLD